MVGLSGGFKMEISLVTNVQKLEDKPDCCYWLILASLLLS